MGSTTKLLGLLLATLAIGLLTLQREASGSHEHRACKAPPNDQELQDAQQDVLKSPGLFDYLSRQYRFSTFSLWGRYSPNEDKLCIRYEAENAEAMRIEALTWPDAGIYFIDLEQNKRISWIREFTPAYPAVAEKSKVKAFQNSWAEVRTYLPTAPKMTQTHSGTDVTASAFAKYDIQQSAPFAAQAVREAGLGTDVIAISTEPRFQREPLTSIFASEDIRFSYYSYATNKGTHWVVANAIKFQKGPPDLEVLVPYVSALHSLEGPSSEDSIVRFSLRIKEFRGVWQRPQDGLFGGDIMVPTPQQGQLALFIVEHPITIKTGQKSFCIAVKAYSVVPVAAAGNFCGGVQ